MPAPSLRSAPGEGWPAELQTVAREWTRIGCVGFGGPPAHIALFRQLCVVERAWLSDEEFEDAIAATNLLPGPASTQLAIFCGWRVRGTAGALVGGLGFIVPGLVLIIALSALFLAGAPPAWIRGAGAGAGAAVAAVAVHAGLALLGPGWARTRGGARLRWVAFVLIGLAAVPLVGAYLVLVLLACGLVELGLAARPRPPGGTGRPPTSHGASSGGLRVHGWPVVLAAAVVGTGGIGALAWLALKVGALSYGGGFVIIPLMQADAVDVHGWMTDAQFVSAVALGQVTPGPVVHTVAVVGYAAAAVPGALLAAVVAFAPSFSFILIGAERFDRLRSNRRVRAFLAGAGPAAAGAIVGSAIPLAAALSEVWQWAVLALAAVALLVARRGVVSTLLAAGVVGAAVGLAGGPLP